MPRARRLAVCERGRAAVSRSAGESMHKVLFHCVSCGIASRFLKLLQRVSCFMGWGGASESETSLGAATI
eukprot:714307-Rhodomonas_salina.1